MLFMPIFDSDTCCNFQATEQYGGPAELTKNNIHVGVTNQNSRYIPTKLLLGFTFVGDKVVK